MTEQTLLQQPADYARYIVDVASDKLAADIVLLDIREVSDFADFFVILTVESVRQMRAVVEDLEHALESKGYPRHHREGTPTSGWMLLESANNEVARFFAPDEIIDYERAIDNWIIEA